MVAAAAVGQRLDRYLSGRSDVSRSRIQQDIKGGKVSVNGEPVDHPSHRLHENDRILWRFESAPLLRPARLPLSILHEDDEVVAIDKPIGLVVHPGTGTHDTTLVEALLVDRRLPMSDDPSRPGIVHRLDKETSGAIVVAKTHAALGSLQAQFAERTTVKFYLAVVAGRVDEETGLIDAPIGRDPTLPSRMAINAAGKNAVTEFRVLDRNPDYSVLLLLLHTGRTHQLRVHLKYIGHPVVGDEVYGNPRMDRKVFGELGEPADGQSNQEFAAKRTPYEPAHGQAHKEFPNGETPPELAERQVRMMLHAWRLQVTHPVSGEPLQIEAPIPDAFPSLDYDRLPWERNAVRP